MKARYRLATAALLGICLSACDSDGRTRPPPTTVRIVHAATEQPGIELLREQRREATLGFAESTSISFDSGEYDFTLRSTPPGATGPTQLATFSANLLDSDEYVIVVTESGGSVTPLLIGAPLFDPASTSTQLIVVHAAARQAAYDVYVEAPGTVLGTVAPLGSLAYGGNLPPEALAAGDFRLWLTAPGDAADVRFESRTIALAAGASNVLVIADDARGLVDTVVLRVGQSVTSVVATGQGAGIRFINAITDQTTRDVLLDGDAASPLMPALGFGVVPDYAPVPAGEHEFAVTPAGNPSVEEFAESTTLGAGFLYTGLIVGNTTDGLIGSIIIEDKRPVSGEARIRIVNGANLVGGIDALIGPPGVDPATIAAAASLGVGGISNLLSIAPGSWELNLRSTTSGAIVAGPVAMTLVAGGVYGVLALDAPGGSTADVVVFDDFN